MKNKNKKVFLALLFVVSTSVGNAQANLLLNPSFELSGTTTAILGWTPMLSGVEWFNATSFGGAADGVMAVDLANFVYPSGGVQQTFATTPGEKYSVSFSAGNHSVFGRDGTSIIQVDIAGLHLEFGTAVGITTNIIWKTIGFDFTAIDSSTTLLFTNTQNPWTHFAYIDSVNVEKKLPFTSVPEPATFALMLSGLGFIGFAAHRRLLPNPRITGLEGK